MSKEVKTVIPGSPEAKARSQKLAQEFVDNLNRNVIKEDETYNENNKTSMAHPKLAASRSRISPWPLVGVIVVALFLVLFLIDRVVLMKVEARCLEIGYTQAKIAWYINGYQGYCVGNGYAIPAPKFER